MEIFNLAITQQLPKKKALPINGLNIAIHFHQILKKKIVINLIII